MRILLLLLVSFGLQAQSDSLAIKLKHYKSLYEQGLIDSAEYKQIKQSVISPNTPTAIPPQTRADLLKLGKDHTIVGGVFTAFGISNIAGGFIYRHLSAPSTFTPSATYLYRYRQVQGVLFGVGAAATITGVVFIVSGQTKLMKAKGLTNLEFSTSGLCLNF